jgi:mono/diheme cytochrome c family protein
LEENSMKRFLVAALALVPTLAHAHGTMTAWFGGQTVETPEGARIEFIVRDGAVKAWVRDHDDKALAASGKVTLLIAGKKAEADFKPDGNTLVATAPVTPADKLTAVLALSVAGKPVSARFAQDALSQPTLDAKAEDGRQAFQAVCATCHGTQLRGTDNAPPLLHPAYGPKSGHGDDTVLAAIQNGAKSHMWKFGDMPKPQGVKPGQESAILAYIRAMQAANGLGAAPAAAAPAMDHSHHHH